MRTTQIFNPEKEEILYILRNKLEPRVYDFEIKAYSHQKGTQLTYGFAVANLNKREVFVKIYEADQSFDAFFVNRRINKEKILQIAEEIEKTIFSS